MCFYVCVLYVFMFVFMCVCVCIYMCVFYVCVDGCVCGYAGVWVYWLMGLQVFGCLGIGACLGRWVSKCVVCVCISMDVCV